jgi:hypothetical protein
MANSGMRIHIVSETGAHESIWRLPTSRTPGAFRLFSSSGLLNDPPSLALYEWKDIDLARSGQIPCYAPISHVWKSSPEVTNLSRIANRPLRIQTRDAQSLPHEISWLGLVQAALAAQRLGCDYLWLDLLCIDQLRNSDREKEK